MRVKLTNFSLFESYECDLGDSGLTLLSGPSGHGKSSILRAINFCLTGEGTKLASYNSTKKGVKVEIWYKNLYICRTKVPNRLIVEDEKGRKEDDHAEAVLKGYFPSNFSVCGYIRQKSACSFLSMTPGGKLEYLEKMALGDEVETVKKETSNLLSTYKTRFDSCNSVLQYMRDDYNKNIVVNIPNYTSTGIKLEILDEMIEQTSKTIKELSDSIPVLQKEISQAEEIQLAKKEYDMLDKMRKAITIPDKPSDDTLKLKEELSNLQRDIRLSKAYTEYLTLKQRYALLLQNETDRLKEAILSLGETKDTSILLQKAKEAQDRNARRDEYAKMLNGSGIDTSPDKLREIEQEITDLSYKKGQLELAQTLLTCPSCTSSLRLLQGNLVLYEKKEDIQSLDLKEITSTLSSLTVKLSNLKKIDAQRQFTMKKLEELGPREEVEDVTLLIDLNEKHKRKTMYLKELEDLPKRQALKTLELQIAKTKIEDPKLFLSVEEMEERSRRLEKEIKEYTTLLQEYNLKVSQKTALDEKIVKIVMKAFTEAPSPGEITCMKKKVISLYDSIHGLQDHLQKLQKGKVDQAEYEAFNKRKLTLEKDMKEKEEETMRVQKEYIDLQRFKSLLTRAEGIALASLIDEINTHLQSYLDVFFPENPITVSVDTEKETKKGDKRSQICIKVGYRGVDTDLNTLSGGERDRVDLAFTLALSEIFDSPIVMLDESLSSLDSVTSETILSYLQEKDRLYIIVSHQAPNGIFSKVVKV